MNNIFIFYLIIHVIGDYYIQNDKLAIDKNNNLSKLLFHGLLYLIISLIFIIPIFSYKILIYTITFAAIHFLIDFLKFSLHIIIKNNRWKAATLFIKKEIERGSIYVIDQMLHLLSIYMISYYFVQDIDTINSWIEIKISPTTYNKILKFSLMIVLLLKPVNITFRKLLGHIKPTNNIEESYKNNTGQLVGNLERLLVGILLILNQYTAIGLVFTAKSITRYDKISHDKEFAEYYLLGTLFSILSTLIIYLIIFKI